MPLNRPNAPCIGLTGGIASGKSAAAEFFRQRGAAIIDADIVARELVAPGQAALAAIASEFGSDFLTKDGALDRRKMRQHVFSSDPARRQLEALLHPRIRAELERRAIASTAAFLLVAVPLLAEAGRYPWLERVLVIDVHENLQLARLQLRDAVDRDQALAALAAQASRAQRLKIADDVIINDASLAALENSVERLNQRYQRMTSET